MRSSYCGILRFHQIWRRLGPLRDRIGHFIDLTRRARRARCPNLSDSLRRAASRSRASTLALAGTVLAALAPAHGEELVAQRIPIAVVDLDYADTSGEVRNQQAERDARLRTFVDMLRADLEQDGHYRIVTLECRQSPCTAGQSDAASLVESARAAGARLLLYGGIQKMSTLIQHVKVQVVDLQTNKLVFDRLISFRGDTDESWQRAERFLVRDLRSAKLGSTL